MCLWLALCCFPSPPLNLVAVLLSHLSRLACRQPCLLELALCCIYMCTPADVAMLCVVTSAYHCCLHLAFSFGCCFVVARACFPLCGCFGLCGWCAGCLRAARTGCWSLALALALGNIRSDCTAPMTAAVSPRNHARNVRAYCDMFKREASVTSSSYIHRNARCACVACCMHMAGSHDVSERQC